MSTIEPYDENQIEADDTIIRRINPVQHLVDNHNTGTKRVSTKAFSPSSEENGGMSVDIEKLILEDGQEPKQFVTTPTFTGSVSFSAKEIRDLNLRIGYDPRPENPYHGEVWGERRPNRFSKGQKNTLLSTAKWYVKLDNVELN